MMMSSLLSQLGLGDDKFITESVHCNFEGRGHLPDRDSPMKNYHLVHYGSRRIKCSWSFTHAIDK